MLFATTSQKRKRNMMDELAKIARNGKSTMFGFLADPGFESFLKSPPPSGRLLTSPWARVGNPDLVLAEAPTK